MFLFISIFFFYFSSFRKLFSYFISAQALRAGTALRLGRRLGLMPAATMADLVDAVSRASGLPPDYVRQALDGPPPLSDRSLMDLAAQLDRLESEVSS